MKLARVLLSAGAALFLSACCWNPFAEDAAEFSVMKMYGDHMVLQQGRPVEVYGYAKPGQSVIVEFNGHCTRAEADAEGVWHAELPEAPAGGPYTMKITGKEGAPEIVFQDILVGEVWICAGQSNMEMPLYTGSPFWQAKDADFERITANHPKLRFYNSSLKKRTSPCEPLMDENGPGWAVCSPETAAPFSACGYFFGRNLIYDLQVPVGLVSIPWGGTRIEAWCSPQVLAQAGCRKELEKIHYAKFEGEAALGQKVKEEDQKWMDAFLKSNPDEAAKAAGWKDPAFDDSGWEKAKIPYTFPDGKDGFGWYRVTFELPEDWAGKDLLFKSCPIDDNDDTYFNGERIGGQEHFDVNNWDKQREYKVPGALVKAGKNTIAIRLYDYHFAGGFSTAEAQSLIRESDKAVFQIPAEWKFKVESFVDAKKLGTRPHNDNKGFQTPHFPSTLFNAQLFPWLKVPFRGVIWYQGCSNNGQENYWLLNRLMIEDWRKKCGNPEMPFLLVQLAGFYKGSPAKRGEEDFWKTRPLQEKEPYALTREHQAEMTRLPKVGMAVAMDIGDAYDIHPRNKQEVGWRLAKEAERIAYGKDIVSRGPEFQSMKIEGNKIRVFFKYIGAGLETKDKQAPGAFAIAGADGKYVWADAEIDGDTVVVSSPSVPEPKHVRYAWAGYRGDVNLRNKDGFPAVPFRSDKPVYKMDGLNF